MGSPRAAYDFSTQPFSLLLLRASATLVLLGIVSPSLDAQQPSGKVLRIGTSGNLSAKKAEDEKSALKTLQDFIHEETGLDNEIVRESGWNELAKKMAKNQLPLGVFQGYEFAWAKEAYPKLAPLAIAVNVYKFQVVHIVARRDDAGKSFADLAGQTFCLPNTGQQLPRFYLDRQCQGQGKTPETFFAKVSTRDNVEDALDDVVDGLAQCTVVEQAGLEAFRRRKPVRFAKLRSIVQSQPFPPPVVACYDDTLDQATRQRYLDGLLGAKDKEKGRTLLNLFRLTSFEPVPDEFDKALATTRRDYPPPRATVSTSAKVRGER